MPCARRYALLLQSYPPQRLFRPFFDTCGINLRDCVFQEDAHGWLRCLADNTLTARTSETALTDLFAALDTERSRAYQSLKVMTPPGLPFARLS